MRAIREKLRSSVARAIAFNFLATLLSVALYYGIVALLDSFLGSAQLASELLFESRHALIITLIKDGSWFAALYLTLCCGALIMLLAGRGKASGTVLATTVIALIIVVTTLAIEGTLLQSISFAAPVIIAIPVAAKLAKIA
jgi:hypothetical protein